MKTVYAVFFIVKWEGSTLEKLFATKDGARNFVTKGIKTERWKGRGKWEKVPAEELFDEEELNTVDKWANNDLSLVIAKRSVCE